MGFSDIFDVLDILQAGAGGFPNDSTLLKLLLVLDTQRAGVQTHASRLCQLEAFLQAIYSNINAFRDFRAQRETFTIEPDALLAGTETAGAENIRKTS